MPEFINPYWLLFGRWMESCTWTHGMLLIILKGWRIKAPTEVLLQWASMAIVVNLDEMLVLRHDFRALGALLQEDLGSMRRGSGKRNISTFLHTINLNTVCSIIVYAVFAYAIAILFLFLVA